MPQLNVPSYPAELHPLVSRMIVNATAVYASFRESAGDGSSVDYAAQEEAVAEVAAEFERGLHEVSLRSLDVDAPFIEAEGVSYRRSGKAVGRYNSLSGAVSIERTTYRRLGQRTGETVDAISLRAGTLSDGWLPRAAQAMGHLMALGTSREAKACTRSLQRLPYSRATFERMGHVVGNHYKKGQRRIEQKLSESYQVPADAGSISVSIDRVSMPMEEPISEKAEGKWLFPEHEEQLKHLPARRPESPWWKAQRKEDEYQSKNRQKPKIQVNHRMAYVATVTIHDGDVKAIETLRYGRMPKDDTDELCRRMVEDVCQMRKQRPDLKVSLLSDGAPELWDLFRRHFTKKTIGIEPVELIDVWHLLEYLAAAAKQMEAAQVSWPGTFRRFRARLFNEPDAAEAILTELRQSGLEKKQHFDKTPVADAIRYMSSRLDRMNYAESRAQGLPIGSGSVEATCKSLVSVRMRRPGARWKTKTADEVLQLRALHLSSRFDRAMTLAFQPLRKSVAPLTRPEALAA